MNIGYEEDELKPYIEPPKDQRDDARVQKLQQVDYVIEYDDWLDGLSTRDSQ